MDAAFVSVVSAAAKATKEEEEPILPATVDLATVKPAGAKKNSKCC